MNRLVALFEVDLRALAAMRVLAAMTFLWILFVWALDLSFLFTDAGALPRDALTDAPGYKRFSILVWLDGYWIALALWLASLAAATALLFGFRSRLAAFVVLVIYLTFLGRNPMIMQGGDVLLPLLLFWMAVLPIGAVWSVDAALAEDRRGERICNIATVGLLLQVLYVYVFGALLKTSPVWWPDGTAVYVALHIDSFVTPLGRILREFGWMMALLTWFVYLIELWSPVLLFVPDRLQRVRAATWALLVAMHLGFRVFLHIGHFWLSSLTSLCAFIPHALWDWLGRYAYAPGTERIRVYYDRDCGFCLKTALIFREFFLPRSIQIEAAQDTPEIGEVLEREVSWVVIGHEGAQRLHWDAVAYVMMRSRLMRPFGLLSAIYGASGLGKPTYDLIGRNRMRLSVFTKGLKAPKPYALGAPLKIVLGAVIAYSFLANLRHHWTPAEAVAETGYEIADAMGFTQKWDMFAPLPPTRDGFPVWEAALSDGGSVDLVTGEALSLETPIDVVGRYETHRQRAILFRGWAGEEDLRDLIYGRFVDRACNRWNADNPDRKALEVTARFIESRTKANYEDEKTVRTFFTRPCPPSE
ncbi:MAG: HTTM domain-containing protein [Pseudomonadota bacterium]